MKKADLLLYALLSLLFANAQSRQATFHFGCFTLTSKDDKFCFIDANDIEVIKLDQWEKAEPSESTGFAKTKKQENDGLTDYLLDSMGQTYQVKDLYKTITTLDLSNQGLKSIPAEVFNYKNLTWLNLSNNLLSSLPQQFIQLFELQTLYLNENQFSSFPRQITQLPKLNELNLATNQLTTLPPEIGQLAQLRSLDLSANQLTALPPQIGQLNVLFELNLSYNPLSSLPEQIGKLTQLNTLDLTGNQLTKLQPEIGQLDNLSELSLQDNQLTSLPEPIGQLTNLVSLNIAHNHLTILPPQIGQLANLVSLNIAYNQLTALPPQIGQLRKLNHLNLSGNQFTLLSQQIGELQSLLELDVSENPIAKSELENIYQLLPYCELVSWKRDMKTPAEDLFHRRKYQDAYLVQKEATAKNENDVVDWYLLGLYALFVGKAKEAIPVLEKTQELCLIMGFDFRFTAEALLPLAYLLDNQWSEAEKIYRKWKGKPFLDQGRSWDKVFLEDLNFLRKSGVWHPDFEKVKKLFEK